MYFHLISHPINLKCILKKSNPTKHLFSNKSVQNRAQTTKPSNLMSIKKLDNASVSSICINQVVVDMPMCVKELLENSLDAGATKIGK